MNPLLRGGRNFLPRCAQSYLSDGGLCSGAGSTCAWKGSSSRSVRKMQPVILSLTPALESLAWLCSPGALNSTSIGGSFVPFHLWSKPAPLSSDVSSDFSRQVATGGNASRCPGEAILVSSSLGCCSWPAAPKESFSYGINPSEQRSCF